MITYKFLNDKDNTPYGVVCSDGRSFPFDPANTDYQQFKKDAMDGAELQDADGNVMSQADATEFVSNLP